MWIPYLVVNRAEEVGEQVEEQKCWRTASNSVRIANDVLHDTETENAESMSQEEEIKH